jgi:hypothetical protein
MSKKDDEINRQLIFNSGGANPEDYLTPKQLQRYNENPERFIDIDVDLAMSNRRHKMNAYVAKYTKPIPLEELPYTPVELGDMLDSGEKEREIEVEGYGKGRLVISKQNKNKPFFYADEKNEAFNIQQAKKAERLFFFANAPAIFAPVLAPFTARTKPANVVLKDPVLTKGKKVTGPLPGSKGGQTLLQQRKTNKQTLAEFEATGFGKTKIAEDVFNMPTSRVQQIVKIAKRNNISYQKAEQYVNLKEQGITPTETLNPGTNAGLIEGDLPLNVIHARLMKGAKDKGAGDMKMIDLGLPAFGQGRRKESVTEYRNRHFNQAGFKKDENGNFIFDDRLLKQNVKGEARRLTSQLAQTKPSQTVKSSFERTREKTKLPFVEELGGYMKLTGSKPNLHHRFAAMVVAPLYRNLPLDDTPGSEWMELTGVLNESKIYPGSPIYDPDSYGGPKSNLTQLVTKGFNEKVILPDGTEKVIRRPAEPHDIMHHQYYKEMGLQDVEEGKASWFDKRMYKITGSREGRMEVARELAEIVNEGDRIIDEAMGQIRALFGNRIDPDYIVKLLTELAKTGKLKITGTKYRLKSIEAIVRIMQKEVKANLPLADEQEVLNTVAQYKLDYEQEIEAIDLLHNIADYNESMRVFGKRPPSITHSQHKRNIRRYMDLIQTKIPLDLPTQKAKEQGLSTYTYKRVKPVPIDKQLEIIFADD